MAETKFSTQALTAPSILSTVAGIDLKAVATTNLYTVPTGKVAIITEVLIRITTATALTITSTLGVGVAAGEADIMASTALVGLTLLGGVYRFSCEGTFVSVAAASVIKLGVDTGATATTATGEVTLIGFLL